MRPKITYPIIALSKKNRIIIRVLYGNQQQNSSRFDDLLKDIKIRHSEAYSDKCLNVVCGENNYNFLKECGAKNLLLFDKKNFIQPEGYNHFWIKQHIIRHILDEYKEVCYLDWDNRQLKEDFDEDVFWNALCSKKNGHFDGALQTALVKYKSRWYSSWRCKDPKWQELNKNDNENYSSHSSAGNSVIYCREKSIIDEWLSCFQYISGNTDEVAFNYYYDKICPYSSKQKMFDDFGCLVVYHKIGLFKEKLNPFFRHK
jgi:hypothetical protein